MQNRKLQLKQAVYWLYRRFRRSAFIGNMAFFFFDLMQRICNPYCRLFFADRQWLRSGKCDLPSSQIKVAFICDEMTWQTFCDECDSIFLTPNNWKKVLKDWKPDVFFCESTWLGKKNTRECWRGKIYKNHMLAFENRKTLLHILNYCKKAEIPTVFWNKEDPTYFGSQHHDFVDTALKFDRIYTTCEECILKYQDLGHFNVHLLQFGANANIYNPQSSGRKLNQAVFAGSWYGDLPERCKEMEHLFDAVLELGIKLVIYDRNYGSTSWEKQFPSKYQPYVQPSIPFEELGKVLKQSQYAININTVSDSSSMFARRVFEVILCNMVVISNTSEGMKRTFPRGIVYDDHPFTLEELQEAKKYVEENLNQVLTAHLNHHRFEQICSDLGFNATTRKHPIIRKFAFEEFEHLSSEPVGVMDAFYIQDQFVPTSSCLELQYQHFTYLDPSIGISIGNVKYEIQESNTYTNTLWHVSMWGRLLNMKSYFIYKI